MKKLVFAFLLFILMVFSLTSLFSSQTYTIVQLTDNEYDDFEPQINDNNDVVWQGYDGNDYEIFLYQSTSETIIQITDNSYNDYYPQINNNGDIAWQGNNGTEQQIFLYESMTDTIWEIASGLPGSHWNTNVPYINNKSDLVWQGYDGSRYNIFFYDNTAEDTVQLTSDILYDNYNPRINDNGEIAWFRHYRDTFVTQSDYYLIMVYDNTSGESESIWSRIHPISEGLPFIEDIVEPRINTVGNVVWEFYDIILTDFEVFYYESESRETIQLTDNSYDDFFPEMNSSGDVVWRGQNYVEQWENIFFYKHTTEEIFQITNSADEPYWGPTMPQISDNGYLTWQAVEPEIVGWNNEVYVYDGSEIINISDSPYNEYFPKINGSGNVVWDANAGLGDEIFLAVLEEEEDDQDGDGENGDENSGGPFIDCFIATACYGTPRAEQVKTLRAFRDRYLVKVPIGRILIKLYYSHSPKVAEFIRKKESLKAIISECLKPFIWIINKICVGA